VFWHIDSPISWYGIPEVMVTIITLIDGCYWSQASLWKLRSSFGKINGFHHDLVNRYWISVSNYHGYVIFTIRSICSFMAYHRICTRRVPLFRSTSGFSGFCVYQSLIFCMVFCRWLFVFLSMFSWYLHCLSFFDLRILTIHVVSSVLQTIFVQVLYRQFNKTKSFFFWLKYLIYIVKIK
jgi:hypothetical protein